MAANQPTTAAIEAVIRQFKDPESGRSVAEMGQVRDLRFDEATKSLSLTLELTTHSAPLWKETQSELIDLLRAQFPDLNVRVDLAMHRRPPQKLGQLGVSIKSVIAVGSGKGGVGKSTVATCLALGLQRAGAKVGLMDADVYGPSVPHLLGVDVKPDVRDSRLIPPVVNGLQVMSMGFLVPAGEAVVWRGPMLHRAMTNFLSDTLWDELDYLVIDMPPGTGDIALSLSQLVPLTGAVVVCTPQDVALLDAVKAIAMFRKVNIPVLGMVENMSYFLCPNCGQRYDIFGSGGAERRAAEMSIPFLGEVPIQISIRANGDAGQTSKNFDDSTSAKFFEAIAHRLVKNLADANRQKPPMPTLPVL